MYVLQRPSGPNSDMNSSLTLEMSNLSLWFSQIPWTHYLRTIDCLFTAGTFKWVVGRPATSRGITKSLCCGFSIPPFRWSVVTIKPISFLSFVPLSHAHRATSQGRVRYCPKMFGFFSSHQSHIHVQTEVWLVNVQLTHSQEGSLWVESISNFFKFQRCGLVVVLCFTGDSEFCIVYLP